jgi:oligosaccharide repeat unit polymerase
MQHLPQCECVSVVAEFWMYFSTAVSALDFRYNNSWLDKGGDLIYRGRKMQSTSLNARYVFPLQKRTFLLHPFLIFSSVWLGVALLYSLHLSKMLQYSTRQVFTTVAYIWIPYAVIVALCTILRYLLKPYYSRKRTRPVVNLALLETKLKIWFKVWVLISLVEIYVSGGMPIVWLFTGNTKTYVDFGISSLHGVVNALLTAIALCRFSLFLLTGKKRHLYVPIFALLWSILAITRQLMLVSLIEFAFIFLQMRPIRKTTFVKIAVGALAFVLAFGFIGDLRQGSSDGFRALAQPSEDYPEWFPSGFLWAYIYISTPINNLMYTMEVVRPVDNFLFPNTASTLFPSMLRYAIYGEELGEAASGQLVVSAFNVSTAYVGPYQDFGLAGMALLSILSACITLLFWFQNDLRSVLMFSVATQCLMLNLFYNQFFVLPMIMQIVWLFYFFPPKIRMSFGESHSSARRQDAKLLTAPQLPLNPHGDALLAEITTKKDV